MNKQRWIPNATIYDDNDNQSMAKALKQKVNAYIKHFKLSWNND